MKWSQRAIFKVDRPAVQWCGNRARGTNAAVEAIILRNSRRDDIFNLPQFGIVKAHHPPAGTRSQRGDGKEIQTADSYFWPVAGPRAKAGAGLQSCPVFFKQLKFCR